MAFMESQSPVDACLLEERSVCYIYISCARGQAYKYITTSRDFGPGGGGGGGGGPSSLGGTEFPRGGPSSLGGTEFPRGDRVP